MTRSAPTRREILLVGLLALLAAAWPLRAGILEPDRVLLGVDTAAVHLPWRAAIEENGLAETGVARPRNDALSDQGLVFYPLYRWIATSLLQGDAPLWNPLIYAGVPAVGNPQSGVLDPQVWVLVLLEALGGEALFDRGFALLAWMRLVAAGLGAYFLARRLGLGSPGAALAGVGFGLSGWSVLWLGHPLGHVSPFLPWLLLALESIGGPRRLGGMVAAALLLGGAILGGHPETAFFVGLTGGLWALAMGRESRGAGARGLLALLLGTGIGAVSLVPFVEYLGASGARATRLAGLAAGDQGGFDLHSLAVLFVLLALALGWRLTRSDPPPESGASIGASPGRTRTSVLLAGVGLALAAGGTALLLRARGLEPTAVLSFFPDFHGAPGSGGYRGAGTFLEEASTWLPAVILAAALASLLSPASVLQPRGGLSRRGLVAPLALISWLLALRCPGLLDLYRLIPELGLGETVRLASVSALCLSLLAGEALERAPRPSRAAAVGIFIALAAALAWQRAPAEGREIPPVVDENLGMLLTPPRMLEDGRGPIRVEGWVDPRVAVSRARLVVERIDSEGDPVAERPHELPVLLFPRPSAAALRAPAPSLARVPDGATFFRVPYLQGERLDEGLWRFTLELFVEGEPEPVDRRLLAESVVHRPGSVGGGTMLCLALSLALLVGLPAGSRWSMLLVGAALLQALAFARGLNPAVPRAEVFPPTRTEEILAEILDGGRFFSDPGVLPPDTGLVRGLRALDGYDGMDLASHDAYRSLALDPGVNALLGWHARAVRLDSPAFRLLGVSALALAERLDDPAWELVAGPTASPRQAECFIYRATDPMPRAFCVSRVVSPAELSAELGDWDPLAVACTTADWRPRRAFTRAEVSPPEFRGNGEVRLRASLDGDGLLVLTEQHFAGWTVEVDGAEGSIVDADAIFRGVPLDAGDHELVFRYRPTSLRTGLVLALISLLALPGLVLLERSRRARASGQATGPRA